MFEFHGWASVAYDAHDTNFAKQDACWAAVERFVSGVDSELVALKRNTDCDSLLVAGNGDSQSDVLGVFEWLAQHAPGSYGLLYVRDDDANLFRVWRLCRGKLSEEVDPFLSPAIPTVEEPYDSSREG